MHEEKTFQRCIEREISRFHQLLLERPHGTYRASLSGQIVEASPSLAKMLGYEGPAALLNLNIADFLVDAQAQQELQSLLDGKEYSRDAEIQMRRLDGSIIWVRDNSWTVYDQAGRVTGYEGGLIDVSFWKQVEEDVRRRNEELETITKVAEEMRTAQSRAGICSVLMEQLQKLMQADGVAIALRDPRSGELSIESAYLAWERWVECMIPPGAGISGQVIRSGVPYWTNDIYNDPIAVNPGLYYRLKSIACLPLIANQQTLGVLWMGREIPISDRDISLLAALANMVANAIQRQTLHEDLQTQLEALHQAQAMLVQNEKLAAIGSLVAGVAHELNNPLTTITLYTEMLQQRLLDEEAQKFTESVRLASCQAASIVRSLLDFSRQHPPERIPVQINQVLMKTLDLLTYELSTRNVQVTIDAAPDLPITLADPHQLQQVFVNLINNACQALTAVPQEGRLKIKTATGPVKFRTGALDAGKVIHILFEDNGPGISPQAISRVFDPFFTTKPEGEGTGLGLSVCHGIIHEHNGNIWVESEPGKGTAFFIDLPILAPDPISTEPAAFAPLPAQTRLASILVIDDEDRLTEVIKRLLQRKGYWVDVARNGSEGLEHIAQKNYDLIISDLRIPKMSGPDFYRQVKADFPLLTDRFIFMSGDTISPFCRNFLEETRAPFLAKPFDLNQLIEMVRSLLG